MRREAIPQIPETVDYVSEILSKLNIVKPKTPANQSQIHSSSKLTRRVKELIKENRALEEPRGFAANGHTLATILAP